MIPGRQSWPSAWGYWLLSFMSNFGATGSDMATYWDLLYGEIELPNWLEPFVRIPEFARLRDVRLSNVDSIQFKDFGSASRWSHSIGVAYLASVSCERAWFRYGTRGGAYFGPALLHECGDSTVRAYR